MIPGLAMMLAAIKKAVSGVGDPYRNNVVSLLNFGGADGSTTFTDEKGKTWTAAGNAQIDTSLGYNTGQFDGAGDAITTPHSTDFVFGTGDFTVEGIARLNAVSGTYALWEKRGTSFVSGDIAVLVNAGNIWVYSYDVDTAGNTILESGAGTIVANTEFHWAWTRSGTTMTLWLNGAQVATKTTSASLASAAEPVAIGRDAVAGGRFWLDGRVRASRVTKGVARYTANFTPPTAPFPNIGTYARYWRIYVTATQGSYAAAQEIQMLDTEGTNLCVGGTPISGGDTGPYYKGNAFDGNPAGGQDQCWVSASNGPPCWIGYDFGRAVSVGSIKWWTRIWIYGYSQTPKDFVIQRSSNGTTWTDVKDYAGETSWTSGQANTYRIDTTDPYWTNVVSLMRFQDTDGSTSIVDEKGKTWAVNGNAQIDTAQYKFGTSSLLLDGVDDDITHASHADFGFGTADFTWEIFVRPQNVDSVIFDNRNGAEPATIVVYIHATGNLAYFDTSVKQGSGATIPLGAWTHIAVSRASGQLRMFVGGVKVWDAARTTDMGSARPMRIGRDVANGADYSGHFAEARFTKGVARYTANFTPPSAPFPSS